MPEPKASITSVSLLLRLSHSPSDQAAWEEFVDRYGAKIYCWSRAWQLQDADANDVTQAVLAKLAIQMRRFAYNEAQSFRGWLLRTLVGNACHDYMADRRRSIGSVARGGIDEAQKLLESLPRTWPTYHYHMARCLALRIPPASANRTSSEVEDARRYGDQAMQALRRSVAGGFKTREIYRTSPELEPLHDRDDFRTLLMDLALPLDPFAD